MALFKRGKHKVIDILVMGLMGALISSYCYICGINDANRLAKDQTNAEPEDTADETTEEETESEIAADTQ